MLRLVAFRTIRVARPLLQQHGGGGGGWGGTTRACFPARPPLRAAARSKRSLSSGPIIAYPQGRKQRAETKPSAAVAESASERAVTKVKTLKMTPERRAKFDRLNTTRASEPLLPLPSTLTTAHETHETDEELAASAIERMQQTLKMTPERRAKFDRLNTTRASEPLLPLPSTLTTAHETVVQASAAADGADAAAAAAAAAAPVRTFPVTCQFTMNIPMDTLNWLRMNEQKVSEAFPNDSQTAASQIRNLHVATNDGILRKTYVRKHAWSQFEPIGDSLSNCCRPLRSVLAVNYVDVDIVNAASTYMLDRAIEFDITAPTLRRYVEKREETLRWLVKFTKTDRCACKNLILACTNHAQVIEHDEFGEYSAAYSSWRNKNKVKCRDARQWALALVKEVSTIQRAVIAQIPAELKAGMETAIYNKHGEKHRVEVEKEMKKTKPKIKLTVAEALEIKPLFNMQGKLYAKQNSLDQANTLEVMFDVFEGATAPQYDGLLLPKGTTQDEVDAKAKFVAERVGRQHFNLLIKPFESLDIEIPPGPHHFRHPFNNYELTTHPTIDRQRIRK